LKIDVKGFEYRALQGLDLKKYPVEYLTFEFFPALATTGSSRKWRRRRRRRRE